MLLDVRFEEKKIKEPKTLCGTVHRNFSKILKIFGGFPQRHRTVVVILDKIAIKIRERP